MEINDLLSFAEKWLAWILLFGGVAWRLLAWMGGRPEWAGKRVTAWVETKKARAQERELLAVVLKEFRPNGGSTLRDSADRSEASLARIEGELQGARSERFGIKSLLGGLLSVSDKAYWQSNATGFITWVNPYLCELFGQSEGKLLGHEWKNSVHPDDYAKLMARWDDAVRDGRSYEGHHRVVREDGGIVSVLSHARPMHDASGAVTGWFGCVIAFKEPVQKEVTKPAALIVAPVIITPPRPVRVLWVEDGADLRAMIPLHLKASSPHVAVSTVETARDALQQFCDARELGTPFDFVVLDFNLPEINGLQLAQSLRQIETDAGISALRRAHIAFCTGAPDAVSMADARRLDIEIVLPKPIDWNAVAAFLEQ